METIYLNGKIPQIPLKILKKDRVGGKKTRHGRVTAEPNIREYLVIIENNFCLKFCIKMSVLSFILIIGDN